MTLISYVNKLRDLLFTLVFPFSARLTSAVQILLATLLVVQSLSTEAAGEYFLGMVFLTIGITVARLGLDNILVSEFSPLHFGESESQGEFFAKTISLVFVSSISVLLLLLLTVVLFRDVGDANDRALSIVILISSVVPVTLSYTFSDFFKAKEMIYRSIFARGLLASTIFYCSLLFFGPDSLLDICKLYLISTIVALIVVVFFGAISFSFGISTSTFSFRRLLRRALPMLAVGVSGLVIGWVDGLVVRFFWGGEELALYSVAARLSVIVNFIGLTVLAVYAPKLALAVSSKNIGDIDTLLVSAQKKSIVFGCVVLGGAVLYGERILLLFGEHYLDSYVPFLLLCFGQLVNISFGPVGFLVVALGQEKTFAKWYMFISGVNLLCGLLFIPFFGSIAAATISIITFFSINCICLVVVKHRLNN